MHDEEWHEHVKAAALRALRRVRENINDLPPYDNDVPWFPDTIIVHEGMGCWGACETELFAALNRLGWRCDGRRAQPPANSEPRPMSDPAVDLSIPVKPVGPSGPPLMPALPAELPSSASSVVALETPFRRPLSSSLNADQVERRTMLVGAGVSVSEEIGCCDRLIVAGSLEASLHECRELKIAVGGSFKGNATVATAEIKDRFAGDLVARKRIIIHSTAYVSGSITYSEIEIMSGARVAGILMPDRKVESIPLL